MPEGEGTAGASGRPGDEARGTDGPRNPPVPPNRPRRGPATALGGRPEASRRALWGAFVLVSGFMVGEVVAGALSGSLALLADAGHMVADAGAIGAAAWASVLAARPASPTWTFGLKRAEILAAAGNGVTLLVVAVLVAFDAVRRLMSPPHVDGFALVLVGGVGVLVNLAAGAILRHAGPGSLNLEGALRHVLADLWAFLGTVAAGGVIMAYGALRADPVASLVVVVLMLRSSSKLLRASGRILLQGTPDEVDLAEVRRHILELPEVISVHELHAWTLTSALPVLTAHVVVDDRCLVDGTAAAVLDRLQACLAGHFDVEHSTFQLEPAAHAEHEQPEHA